MNRKLSSECINNKGKHADDGKAILLPALDRYASRKEWEAAAWRKVVGSKELMELLTTSHERHELVMRVAVIEGINRGKSYRQISKEFWVSPQTISGIKKAIQEKRYKSYLERSKVERKKKQYSVDLTPSRHHHPRGRPHRTKYGIVYLPI